MKKRKKLKFGEKKVFYLPIEPYAQELLVVCNGAFEDAYAFFKKQKTRNSEETIQHIDKNRERYFEKFDNKKIMRLLTELPCGYVMFISHRDSWIDTIGGISHECLHLTHYILRRAGLELSSESEEAFTYLQQITLEKILKEIY